MTAGGCPTTMPIWDTEQGIHADGDGYKTKWMSEADVAQFYARDVMTGRLAGQPEILLVLGRQPPTYGFSRHLRKLHSSSAIGGAGRLRLVHRGHNLSEDLQPRQQHVRSYVPGNDHRGVRLLEYDHADAVDPGDKSVEAAGLRHDGQRDPDHRHHDLHDSGGGANARRISSATSPITRRWTRPCRERTVANVCAVNIATTPIVGGVQVTLTGASPTPVDGIVDLISAASTTPKGWPAAQWFSGLALGQSQSFTFVVPAKAGIGQVRVRCGDRRMIETKVAYTDSLAGGQFCSCGCRQSSPKRASAPWFLFGFVAM